MQHDVGPDDRLDHVEERRLLQRLQPARGVEVNLVRVDERRATDVEGVHRPAFPALVVRFLEPDVLFDDAVDLALHLRDLGATEHAAREVVAVFVEERLDVCRGGHGGGPIW